MIISHHYPYLEFRCQVGRRELGGEAYVDTGFDGGLVVPGSVFYAFREPPDSRALLELGDGSVIQAPQYDGIIELGDRQMQASVICLGDECLLGREIIDRIQICFCRGDRIEVEL